MRSVLCLHEEGFSREELGTPGTGAPLFEHLDAADRIHRGMPRCISLCVCLYASIYLSTVPSISRLKDNINEDRIPDDKDR